MRKSVNGDIALTHILTRKRQTIVAAFGVTLGVGVYLFMNSLSSGFSKFSKDEIFKSNPHIRIYKDDETSKPLRNGASDQQFVIVNPQLTYNNKRIVNPTKLLGAVRARSFVRHALALTDAEVFYVKGSVELRGTAIGVNMNEYDSMFGLQKYMVAGKAEHLNRNLDGIIIGSGIAMKLNLRIGAKITLRSSEGVLKSLRIVGISKSGNKATDDSRSFVTPTVATQLLRQDPSYVSAIHISVPDPDQTGEYAMSLQASTTYKVEDWKTSFSDLMAADKTRATLMGAISVSILIVAAFGIYNILSSTIAQKINDIAILKAMGFSGKDVIVIFLMEALMMGFLGTLFGLLMGSVLIYIMSGVYMGGPVGYFPIHFERSLYIRSGLLGIFITFCAGYFPARKAAAVDPVEIFRK